MLVYPKGNEINIFRDGDWMFLNNPCLTDSENKEKDILADIFKQKFKITRIYKTALIPIANFVWKDIIQNRKSNPEKSLDITRALSSIMADIFLVSRIWVNQTNTFTLSDFNKNKLRITMSSIYSHAIATSEIGILLKSKVLNDYDKMFFTEIKNNNIFDNTKNYIKAHTYMLNYINAVIDEFATAKNLECYLTSFINTCKKCKFEIPNYNLLRPVYTDGDDVSNKIEIDTSKLILRDDQNEKCTSKINTAIEMDQSIPIKPTETQAVVIAVPFSETALEQKLKEIECENSVSNENNISFLQEDADSINQNKEEYKSISSGSENFKHNNKKLYDRDSFTSEEMDLISMIKEEWHAVDIMKYFGIRSKNVLKVRLCDLAIRGVDISGIDWSPSNKFSVKVQKNKSIVLSASKLHSCNFALNPGDEVQITCKDGNLILSNKK